MESRPWSPASLGQWPAFGPDRALPRLAGHTNSLPDFIGPIDGSARLTVFTEGNHFPVLLPLLLGEFPTRCRPLGLELDAADILVVTMPQPVIVDMLLRGGIVLGNAVLAVRTGGLFPDLVMAGRPALGRLASAGIVRPEATVFARHRGMAVLLRKEIAGRVRSLQDIVDAELSVIMASEAEVGARGQYLEALGHFLGQGGTAAMLSREVRDFSGRLGIQHRDVPHALLAGHAQAGLIFRHLATYWARVFPEHLAWLEVPGAGRFGQDIAVAYTDKPVNPETEAFVSFLLTVAPERYPAGGFAEPLSFDFGHRLDLA